MANRPYVGVFEDRRRADEAARDLHDRGIHDDRFGYVSRDDRGETQRDRGQGQETKADDYAASGAGTGALLGGAIGAGTALLVPGFGPVIAGGIIATTLAGAATGAAAGGIAGALIGMGVPEDEAKYYDEQVRSGRTVMTVDAGDRYGDASDVIRRRGGWDYETRNEPRNVNINEGARRY